MKLPAGFDGSYNSLTDKPILFDGDYNSLTNRPQIPTVPTNVSAFTNDAGYITMDSIPEIPAYQVLSISNDTIYLTNGGYVKLPTAMVGFSGDYNDLTNKPVLFDGSYNSLTDTPTLFDGSYNSLTDTPVIPTIPENVSAFNNDAQYITMDSVPTQVSWFGNDAQYITMDSVPTQVSWFSNDARYITMDSVPTQVSWFSNDAQYITMDSVPTQVSWFSNDAQYITMDSVPTQVSWFGNDAQYITMDSVPTQVSWFSNDAQYITMDSVPTQVSWFSNDAQYITMDSVPTQVSWFSNDAQYITMDSVPTQVSWFSNDAQYITMDSVPTQVSWFSNDAGYLSVETQNLAHVTNMGNSAGNKQLKDVSDPTDNQDAVTKNYLTNYVNSIVANLQYQIDSLKYVISTMGSDTGGGTPPCPPVNVTITAGSTELCEGEHTTLTATGAVTYKWSYNGSVFYGNDISSAGGFYTVTGTDANSCEGTASIEVIVHQGTYTTVTDTACGSYIWHHQDGTEETVTENGTHYYHYINDYGCASLETLTLDLSPCATTPSVHINDFTDVTSTSAGVHFSINSTGGAPLTSCGICWSTSPNPTLEDNHTTGYCGGVGTSYDEITGLTPGTTYFVRAYATNSVGTAYSDGTEGFTTSCGAPTNVTVSNITLTGATVSWPGSSNNSEYSVAYRWNSPYMETSWDSISVSDTQYVFEWLTPTYSYEVRVKTNCGDGNYSDWSDIVSFTTLSVTPPTVTTAAVSDVTYSSAVCGGEVTGDAQIRYKGVCWGTSPNPIYYINYVDAGEGAGSFTSTITGLTGNTTYYVRAFAVYNTLISYDSYSIVYGEEYEFTTLAPPSTGGDGQPCPGVTVVSDIDNNVYNTVKIGEQCWMKENLRTTHYPDGDFITDWYRQPSYGMTQGDSIYGYLYKWDAVMHGAASSDANPSGVQGICPAGWHVPSSAEWAQLSDYLISQPGYLCDGYNISKALATTYGWSSNCGSTCCNGINPEENNATGFSALPDNYYASGAHFWSSSTYKCASLGDYFFDPSQTVVDASTTYSVRCLHNSGETSALPSVTTSPMSDITATTAVCGGHVVSDGGESVIARGVCWNTSPNPTLTDSEGHTTDGDGTGEFTSEMTELSDSTVYYVRAYATNSAGTAYGNTVMFHTDTLPPYQSEPCPGHETVTDIDNNVYNTVKIGEQCWMKENLRTTRYADGTLIQEGTTGSDEEALRYAPTGDNADVATYGYLYNWRAATRGITNDTNAALIRGACPEGWHIPSDAEWNTMEAVFTDANLNESYNYRGNHAGKMATGTWTSSNEDNAPGNVNDPERNMSGFSALAAGYYDGSWNYSMYPVGTTACFWTSSPGDWDGYWVRSLDYSQAGVYRGSYSVANGLSVRCILGSATTLPAVSTGDIDSVGIDTAVCRGNVTYDGNAEVTARGFCWGPDENPSLEDNHIEIGTGLGEFSFVLTGLSPAHTYHVRAYATNSEGTSYGEDQWFTTQVTFSTLATSPVTEITQTSAVSGGVVTFNGGMIYQRGICYSLNPEPTTSDYIVLSESQSDTFTVNMSFLTAGTTYYVRAFLKHLDDNIFYMYFGDNSEIPNIIYGEEFTFTTLPLTTLPCPGAATVVDIDNNVYNTVMLGNQCWMKENLRTTRYADGTEIYPGTANDPTNPRLYAPGGNTANVATYGYLYNWPAVMNGSESSDATPSGVQGPCPTGWHVPSSNEWRQMECALTTANFSSYGWHGDHAGKMVGSDLWYASSEEGAPGNMSYSQRNLSEMTILPAGVYDANDGGAINLSYGAWYWTTSYFFSGPYYFSLQYHNAGVFQAMGNIYAGMSLRCLRDDSQATTGSNESAYTLPKVTTSSNITDITTGSASIASEITFDGYADVTVRGVCWSTSHNPTLNDSHTTDGNGTGAFNSSLTGLAPSTTYFIRAYATNSAGTAYGNEVSFTTLMAVDTTHAAAGDALSCPEAATVTDIDNNVYNTVKIGTQCWMKENLRTTHLPTGTLIATSTAFNTDGPYILPVDSNPDYVATYGYLYNWPAIMNGECASSTNPSWVQGICPAGWHVPSEAEWNQLFNYVKSQEEYVYGNSSDNIAKALAATTGWQESSVPGTPGNDIGSNNSTGFSALPAGFYGIYENIDSIAVFHFGETTSFGSTTRINSASRVNDNYVSFEIQHDTFEIQKYHSGYGLYSSVRCLRDDPDNAQQAPSANTPTVTTYPIINITSESATIGGEVTSTDGADVSHRGVCIGTSPNPTDSWYLTSNHIGLGSQQFTLNNLQPSTTYYVRAIATNCNGDFYGEEYSFTTNCANTYSDVYDTFATAVTVNNDTTYLLYDDFDHSGSASGWSAYDVDGDGYGWYFSNYAQPLHSGSSCLASDSYNSTAGALSPNNYLVLPELTVPENATTVLKWYAAAYSDEYPADHYEVIVSPSGTFDETPSFSETLSSATFVEHTLDLSAYAGQNVRVAFVHNNCSDQWKLLLDDVSVGCVGAVTFTQSGSYIKKLTNSTGCDSLITHHVNILNASMMNAPKAAANSGMSASAAPLDHNFTQTDGIQLQPTAPRTKEEAEAASQETVPADPNSNAMTKSHK
ncbi:MAG: choice-of-anchor J domain-containing protein [Bacteroidales bacterium]|nr:choice-of-anchor J domain-containing protein [Bacteroidales bacterium]